MERLVFQKLVGMVPGLTERLLKGSNEESIMIADLVCRSRYGYDLYPPD